MTAVNDDVPLHELASPKRKAAKAPKSGPKDVTKKSKKEASKSSESPVEEGPKEASRKSSKPTTPPLEVQECSKPSRASRGPAIVPAALMKAITLYARCEHCALDTPFCGATGKAHATIAPCSKCGLSTLFCPQTGRPHGGEESLTQTLESNDSSPPKAALRTPKKKVMRSEPVEGAGDAPPTATKRIEEKEGVKKEKRVQREPCVRCEKRIIASAAVLACPSCKREYHTACYRADTGWTDAADVPTPPCSVCVSGLCPELSPSAQGEDVFVRELLTAGFTVVPLFRNASEKEAIVEALEGLGADVTSLFSSLMKAHECSGTTRTLEEGYSNFRERGKGRYEIIAEYMVPALRPLWEASPCASIVSRVLSHEQSSDPPTWSATGCFFSAVGSAMQTWHSDGPALAHVPLRPYAINAFIPTIAMSKNNGTAFKVGSMHKESEEVVIPNVDVGYALLFDYRVQHRGLTNRGTVPRPCMYITIVQSWYKDTYNFSASRYRHALEVPSSTGETRKVRAQRREAAHK